MTNCSKKAQKLKYLKNNPNKKYASTSSKVI
jgi:hypothetical protein